MEENKELEMEVVETTTNEIEVLSVQPKVNKTKSKKWILCMILVSCLVAGVVYAYYMNYGTKAMIHANTDTITVELGEMVDFNKNNFVKKEDITFIKNNLNKTQEGIFEKINVDISCLEYVPDTYYLALGEHTVKLTTINSEEDLTIAFENNQSEQEIKIIVQDTTTPEFIDFKESVETYKDVPLNLNSLYTAKDLDAVTITTDETDIDYTKVGNYKATVSAADPSGNTETKEVSIIVKSPTIKLNKDSATIYLNNTIDLNASINGKNQTATYSTSDSSIATVDANGKVKGLKEGTVTITASANGVFDSCKITVKKETIKTHTINSKTIISIGSYIDDLGYSESKTKEFKRVYNNILNNSSRVVYCITTGKYSDYTPFAKATLRALTGYSNEEVKPIFEPETYLDENGRYYLLIKEEYMKSLRDRVIERQTTYEKDRKIYRDTIVKALNNMDLKCTDRELVNQINNWICKKLSYKVTGNAAYWEVFSVDKNKGQCYHYANIFNDTCRAVGIKSSYQEGVTHKGERHGWNSVTIEGKTYYFDVTWNDTDSNGKWSWVSEKEFRKTHKW